LLDGTVPETVSSSNKVPTFGWNLLLDGTVPETVSSSNKVPTFGWNLLLDGTVPETVSSPHEVIQLGLLLFQLAKHILHKNIYFITLMKHIAKSDPFSPFCYSFAKLTKLILNGFYLLAVNS
jgi:hypothetical protein